MTQDELREVVARAIFNGMMPSWHWDSEWYEGERAGAYRAFDAALRAIDLAGYAVVPRNKLKVTQDPDVLYGDKNSYAVEWRDDNLEEPAR